MHRTRETTTPITRDPSSIPPRLDLFLPRDDQFAKFMRTRVERKFIMSETSADPVTEPSSTANEKFESGTAHAKAALDETTAAAKEVFETGKKRAQAAIASSKDHLSHAAKDLGEAAGAKYETIRAQATTKAGEYKGRAQEVFSEATSKAQNLQGDTEQYIRENPLQAVGIAAAAGFVIGLIMRR
jgi:ElaB/YqjD/DUF883 family membrane-anchored ribosome-binding protein